MLLGPYRQLIAELMARFESVLTTQDPREIAHARKELEAQAAVHEDNYVR